MMRQWRILAIGVITVLLLAHGGVAAEESVEDLQKQIDELSRLKSLSEQATENLEDEVQALVGRITSLEYQLDQADVETKQIERDIVTREDEMALSYQYLSLRVRSFYKLARYHSPLLTLLSAQTASGLTRELSYRQAAADQDRRVIIDTTEELLALDQDREDLEQRKVQLAAMRIELGKSRTFFEGEIKGARAYQATLAVKIAELSAKQKEILAAKSSTFQTTVGEVPQADDLASRPDYNPGFSPAFAVFSFGAPHYKGMSQYGALGRAKSGQNVEDIVKAYYGNVRIETKDMPGEINTSAGRMAFEDQYLKGIAEMPASWANQGGMEALKAQAIAARTYALSYVGWRIANPSAGGSICVTEQCQVYKSSKASDGASAKWHEAVAATRGQVVVSNNTNEIFATWYASTSGGYQESYTSVGHTTPALWDTAQGRAGWTSQAYEKIGGSPWFYKAWYKTRGGDSCGRSHPWLTPTEMADVVNAWVVLYKAGQSDERVTSSGPCWGGNPYSIDEMRARADAAGGGYRSVQKAEVVYSDAGVTSSVKLQTDRGEVVIKGEDFKKAFNIRAPGSIAVKSGLFNIEQK